MQTANCNVRLMGDMNNEIAKSGVTVAEIVVLRTIHGSDSVVKIAGTGNDKRPHAAELERLKGLYGDKIVEAAFPGAAPQLPVNFKDIGIDIVEMLKAPKAPKAKLEPADAGDAGTGSGSED